MILSEKLLVFCQEHENDDIYNLALQSSRYPDIDISQAIQQIKGLQIAKKKIPSWYKHKDIIYPKHLSLEQSSSEHTARYKQSLCKSGQKMIDLTGGMGIDISFISQNFQKAIYVEKQEELAVLAKHNFSILRQNNIEVINSDSTEYLNRINEEVDLIYLDPSRRDNKGSKTVFIEDCVPNMLEIQDQLIKNAKFIILKMSPMLDISLALSKLKNVSEVHIISVNNDCKELLFIIDRASNPQVRVCCLNIHSGGIVEEFFFWGHEEYSARATYSSNIEAFLYEPNVSVMKSGAFNLISERFEIKKLHKNSHLYTQSRVVDNFPGKYFRVIDLFSLGEKKLKRYLSTLKRVNIVVRNFPLRVDDLRKKINKSEGGNIYLFATTLANDKKVIIVCERI